MRSRAFTVFVFIGILVVAAVLRLWNLGGVPPRASMDEASIGYNAYSVLKTGGDEFGQFPFISQRGYDDWRRSTYLFLVAPFVGVFGLSSIPIRLPAVILSLFTIWAVYEISMLLFSKPGRPGTVPSLIAAALWAISPWHVYLSRIGHETNAYASTSIFGLLFFLRGLKRSGYFIPSMVFFALAIISYYAGQIFIPLFGAGLIALYFKEITNSLKQSPKFRLLFFLVGGICFWIASLTFSPSAIVRFSGTSTFKPEAHWQEYTKRLERWSQANEKGDIIGRFLNSKYTFPLEVFFRAYSSHYQPKWLFFNSGDEPFKAPNTGLLYLWQLPFIFLGLVAVFFEKKLDLRVRKIIFLWFILSSLPGGVATSAPHAMRAYPALFTWELFTAVGIVKAFEVMNKIKPYVVIALLLGASAGLGWFLRNYFVQFPYEQSGSFHFAFSRAVEYAQRVENKYQKIVFSNENNLYQSYMLFLYYNTYDPALYRKQGGTGSGGYAQTHAFGKYEFRPISKNEELAFGTLYIGNVDDFPAGSVEVARFANLDGTIRVKAAIRP